MEIKRVVRHWLLRLFGGGALCACLMAPDCTAKVDNFLLGIHYGRFPIFELVDPAAQNAPPRSNGTLPGSAGAANRLQRDAAGL